MILLCLPADFPPAKDYTKVFPTQDVFKMHPGIINGLFNIKNIIEVGTQFPMANSVDSGGYYVDENNNVKKGPKDTSGYIKNG